LVVSAIVESDGGAEAARLEGGYHAGCGQRGNQGAALPAAPAAAPLLRRDGRASRPVLIGAATRTGARRAAVVS
jgi:hypothetical protein